MNSLASTIRHLSSWNVLRLFLSKASLINKDDLILLCTNTFVLIISPPYHNNTLTTKNMLITTITHLLKRTKADPTAINTQLSKQTAPEHRQRAQKNSQQPTFLWTQRLLVFGAGFRGGCEYYRRTSSQWLMRCWVKSCYLAYQVALE